MTVAVQTPFASFTSSGSVTFAYAFKVNSASDLIVKVNGVTQSSALYSVTGVGSSAGSVVFISAPTVGAVVTIQRKALLQRTTDYQINGDLLAGTVNPDFDAIWMALQDTQYLQNFSIQVSPADIVGVNTTLPTPVGGTVIGWDATGKNLVNFVLSAGTSLVNLAASTGSSLVGFIQSGTGAVARTVQDKARESVSVLDFGADPTGVSAADTAFSNALASGATRIYFPKGTYKFASAWAPIINTTGLVIYGDDFATKLDFSAVTTGHVITFGDGTTGASHCQLSGFWINGGGGASGLRLNGGGVAGTTLCRFSNLTVSNFATNLTTSNAWLSYWDNINFNSPTGVNATIGAATNNALFDRVSFLGGTQAFAATNCQGLQFNSCEFANQTSGVLQAISLTQSNAVLVNPYFENIASSILASVGIPSETTVKSSLTIRGGICNVTSPVIIMNTDKGGLIVNELICATNDVTFFDTGTPSAIYSMVYPSEVTTTPGKTGFTSQYDSTDEVFYGNKNLPPYAAGGGVTFVTKRNWLDMSTSIGGRGMNIGTSLTIGNKYMVVLAIRGTAGNAFLTGVGANRTIPGVPTTSDNWQIQYIPITASAATIALALANTTDTVQVKLVAVIKGHKFPRFDIYKSQLSITTTAAPTVDTWVVGDRVQNSAPAVGQPKGWMCTVAGTPGTWVSEGNL